VVVQWGRRGSGYNEGTKAAQVDLAAAKKAFDRVVHQKTHKGYEIATPSHQPTDVAPPDGQGSASKAAGATARPTIGTRAQLLNTIDEATLKTVIEDDAFVAQQKLDGMRMLVHVEGDIVATNREGKETVLPPVVVHALEDAPEGTIFDGELLSLPTPTYWVFDLLAYADEDLTEAGYQERYQRLESIGVDTEDVLLVPTAWTVDDKKQLYKKLEAQNAEGIVLKRRDAEYSPGRPSSGGPQLKYKFVKSADVLITKNAGNAYSMAVYEQGSLRDIGKVFAGTTNASRQQLDQELAAGNQPVVEVQYLYATGGDKLFQPVFLRFRDDKDASQCVLSQLIHTDKTGLAKL